MDIPQAAIDALPFGYEIKVGDGVWVKPIGCKVFRRDEKVWEDPFGGAGVPSNQGLIYALPVTLDGYELVKVGEIPPPDYKYRTKHKRAAWDNAPLPDVECVIPVMSNDECWFMRPIAVPAPAPVEPVRCPYCGASVSVKFDDGRAYGACFDCDYTTPTRDSTAEIVALIKRTTVAPEPLRCPCGDAKCKVDPFTYDGKGYHYRADCGIRGKRMPTKAQAESEFRKLRYEGGGK